MSKYAFVFRKEIIGVREMDSREAAINAAVDVSRELNCEPIYVVDLAELVGSEAAALMQQPVPGVN
jgi:hypothetical protein